MNPDRRRERLFFDIQRNARYNAKRAGFLELIHRSAMFMILMGGSVAFAAALANSPIQFASASKYIDFLIAAVAALDLVFDYAGRARDHRLQYRRFQILARELARHPEAAGDELSRIEVDYMELLADEDVGYYKALNTICHNEVMIANDRQELRRQISLYQYALAQVIRFSNDDFPAIPRSVISA
jgi:hypothetical protein